MVAILFSQYLVAGMCVCAYRAVCMFISNIPGSSGEVREKSGESVSNQISSNHFLQDRLSLWQISERYLSMINEIIKTILFYCSLNVVAKNFIFFYLEFASIGLLLYLKKQLNLK